MTTMNVREKKQPETPNQVKFYEAVKALLLDENCTHSDLKLQLRNIVLEEGRKLPPVRVLYCTSYGGFEYSEDFTAFLRSRTGTTYLERSDPILIQAISDYGRVICETLPFILDDIRVVRAWKLHKLLAKLSKEFEVVRETEETVFDPDLVAEATSFVEQMADPEGHWKADCLGTFPIDQRSIFVDKGMKISLQKFAEMHPDAWMAYDSFESNLFRGVSTGQVALRFAHVLLQGSDHTRYRVGPDEAGDGSIYEHIGLHAASSRFCSLAIKIIPALVDYSIDEYDGLETVTYGS